MTLSLQVKSLTRVGVTYRVKWANSEWTCRCPSIKPCKHVALLTKIGPKRVAELAGITSARAPRATDFRRTISAE